MLARWPRSSAFTDDCCSEHCVAAVVQQVGFRVGPPPTTNDPSILQQQRKQAEAEEAHTPAHIPAAHSRAQSTAAPLTPAPAAWMSSTHLPEADELDIEDSKPASSSAASTTAGAAAASSSTSSPALGIPGGPTDAAIAASAAASSLSSTVRIRRNWLIHALYIRGEFAECLKVIEAALSECKGLCEYPLYVKALIRRQQGGIAESLQLFQAATVLNPHNIANLKQVGRSLYLSGKHKQAIDVYEEAQRIGIDDWEVYHNKGANKAQQARKAMGRCVLLLAVGCLHSAAAVAHSSALARPSTCSPMRQVCVICI